MRFNRINCHTSKEICVNELNLQFVFLVFKKKEKVSPLLPSQSKQNARTCHFMRKASISQREKYRKQIDPSSVSVLAVILVFHASKRCDQHTGIEAAHTHTRTGKSCVKLVATVELFNPPVPERSIQTVIELDVIF